MYCVDGVYWGKEKDLLTPSWPSNPVVHLIYHPFATTGVQKNIFFTTLCTKNHTNVKDGPFFLRIPKSSTPLLQHLILAGSTSKEQIVQEDPLRYYTFRENNTQTILEGGR